MRQLQLGIQNPGLALSSGLTTNKQPQSGISEIILATDSALQPVYLLPILAQMSLDKRWLMCIGEEPSINRSWVLALGIDAAQVLHIKTEQHCFLQVCCKALAAGTGHIIIEWPGKITDSELAQLDEAAEQGNSYGLLIRRR
ncbi:MAG: cell division inhibitor [Oleispira sp.]|nr:cell division inhibitor [Oleispira sp.]MBL4882848.1 cell division inhibitor [Oleispira sp.]